MQASLTTYQRSSYEHIVASGEAALLRLSRQNPMRGIIARNVADARAKLGQAS